MGIDRTELRRKANENERQYIWRLGSAKDAGLLDLNWEELTDIFNQELRKERSWYNESAYRKPYQMAKAYYDDVFSRMEGGADFADMLTQQRHRLERERMKLRDERRELARLLRDDARLEERISEMERAVQCAGRTSFPAVPAPAGCRSDGTSGAACPLEPDRRSIWCAGHRWSKTTARRWGTVWAHGPRTDPRTGRSETSPQN